MADDPWGKYVTPPAAPPKQDASAATSGGDPWAKYTGETPAQTPATSTVSATPPSQPIDPSTGQPWKSTGNSFLDFLTKPRLTNQDLDTSSPEALALAKKRDPNQKVWKPTGNAAYDFMMYPRAKTEGVGAAAMDTGLSAQDAATFGYGTKLMGAQKNVAQANQNLGVLAPLVQGAAYVAGPGKILGPLARGGAALTGLGGEGAGLLSRTGASMIAGGTEGAAAGGLGAAGHDQNVAEGMLTGGVTGTVGGAFGGSGPAPKAPKTGVPGGSSSAPTGMYADARQAYSPLDSIYFDKSAGVKAANAGANIIRANRNPANMPGVNLGISAEAKKIINDLNSAPTLTGRNIQQASRDLRSLDNGANPNAHVLADQLDKTLATAQPLPASQYQGGPAQVGNAAEAKAAGDKIWGRIQGLDKLDPTSGNSMPSAASVADAKSYYKPGSPEYQALSDLEKTQSPLFNLYHARHVIAPLAFGGASAVEHAYDPNNEHPLLREALHAGTAGALFSGLPGVAQWAQGRPAALNNARYAVGTGQSIQPGTTGRVGDALTRLYFGQQASGP